MAFDSFLINKIDEITILSSKNCDDMYEVIGAVNDVFSSPYIANPVAEYTTVKKLWAVLITVLINDKTYDNKYDAICALYDIYLYSLKFELALPINELKTWRERLTDNEVSLEILECVDEILTVH